MVESTSRRPESNLGSIEETEKIGREFDGDACDFCNRYEKRGLSLSSKILLELIQGEGLRDRSVVDLGCGAGGFSLELLKQGATRAVGIDLSPRMIESANHLAKSNGLEAQAKFQLGNAATEEIPVSDVVVMDKVICCYSDWQPLLKNAINASRRLVGFVVPRDEGIVKWCFRLGVRLVNFFQKRRERIQFYLHPLDRLDKTLRDSGFTQRKKKASRLWLIFLYSRSNEIPRDPVQEGRFSTNMLPDSKATFHTV